MAICFKLTILEFLATFLANFYSHREMLALVGMNLGCAPLRVIKQKKKIISPIGVYYWLLKWYLGKGNSVTP